MAEVDVLMVQQWPVEFTHARSSEVLVSKSGKVHINSIKETYGQLLSQGHQSLCSLC